MAKPSEWADGPWELIEMPSKSKDVSEHGAYYVANEMAFAHNCMLRGLNAMWLQSPHVSPGKDAADLLFFAHSFGEWIAHHHTMEEEQAFPRFEAIEGVPTGALSHEVEQHHAFASTLRDFIAYCAATKGEAYDAGEFRAQIKVFAEPLVEHLRDEIPALLKLDACDEKGSADLRKIWDECARGAANQDVFVVPPMVLGLCDRTADGGNSWPTLPLGAGYFINYVFARRHAGAWRFLPSNHWGVPRPLAFVGRKA